MSQCPDSAALSAWVLGTAAQASTAALEEHVATCDRCRVELSALAKRALASQSDAPAKTDSPAREPVSTPLRRGQVVDRYVIFDVLGAGAMGTVYTAYDPELDRKIALKLIGARLLGSEKEARARLRFAREAQAMARISHPNVVTVYDAGTFGDELFVAMELIDGQNLRRWLGGHRVHWRRILQLFLDAGRGLAAAHQAGLVHRDFKPDNILIAQDGQVRVTDFGLARLTDRPPDEPQEESAPPHGLEEASDLNTTPPGTRLGTPAYMAPELFDGAVADARSDQFSFCVALFEALFGERPYATTELNAQIREMRAEAIRVPSGAPRGTAHLLAVLQRGLRADPAARFVDMPALLDALAFDPARRWRYAGVLLLGAGVAAAVLGVGLRMRTRALDCTRADQALVGIWDPARKASIRQAFSAASGGDAKSAWPLVERQLDGYAEAWTKQNRAVCEASRAAAGKLDTVVVLKSRCLTRRLVEMRALSNLLVEATPSIVNNAVQTVTDLPSVHECEDLEHLRSKPGMALLRTQVPSDERLAADLGRLRVLYSSGSLKEAYALSSEVVRIAEQQHSPLLAEALLRKGQLAARMGDSAEEGLEMVRRAGLLADENLDDEIREQSLILGIHIISQLTSPTQMALGYDYVRQAEAVLRRMGGSPRLEVRLLNATGVLYSREERYDEARLRYARALTLLEGLHEPKQECVTLCNIGILDTELGRYDDAIPSLQRAADLHAEVFGADHAENAIYFINLAVALDRSGRHAEAERVLERTLELSHRMGAAERFEVLVLCSLADALVPQGKLARAQTLYLRALDIAEHSLPAKDPRWLNPLAGMGELEIKLDQPRRAVSYFERALALESVLPGPTSLAEVRFGLARALVAAKLDPRRARTEALAARAAYATAGTRRQTELARIDEWLRVHPAR